MAASVTPRVEKSEREGPATDRATFERLAARHYENFPVGSCLVPRHLRRHVHRIYAFARIADDLADEARDKVALAAFRAEFERHLGDPPDDPVALFVDLRRTIAECSLPVALFLDLLDAFAQDLEQTRYASEAELLDYCRRSADPVGRLVLRVFGYDDPELDRRSDAICTALQLLNHLQDLGADLRVRDRVYFPREDLVRHGVVERALREDSAGPEVRALVGDWLDRIVARFRDGWPIVDAVHGRLRLELRAILCGAAGVVRRIRAADHDVLRDRGANVRLGRLERVATVVRGVCRRAMPVEFA